MVDKSFRNDIIILLEDQTSMTGLVFDWAKIPEACRLLRRRVLRMEDGYDIEIKTTNTEHPKQESRTKRMLAKDPKFASDELVKRMRDL